MKRKKGEDDDFDVFGETESETPEDEAADGEEADIYDDELDDDEFAEDDAEFDEDFEEPDGFEASEEEFEGLVDDEE